MTANELVRQGDHFPLGAGLADGRADGVCEPHGGVNEVLPFGLRYATPAPPSSVVTVDFAKISYDPVRQIALVTEEDGALLPAMKHTSTTTKTSTGSHDRQSSDSDTDASGR